jgi:hypothetical protein
MDIRGISRCLFCSRLECAANAAGPTSAAMAGHQRSWSLICEASTTTVQPLVTTVFERCIRYLNPVSTMHHDPGFKVNFNKD